MTNSVLKTAILQMSIVCFAYFVSVFATAQDALVAEPPKVSSPGFHWALDSTGLSLTQNESLVLRYDFASGHKPIVYPIVGPDGVRMTRDFPMKPAGKDGTKDHIHHRSLWMTHGEVNGIDFWAEFENSGRVLHDKVVSSDVTEQGATLVTTANWVTPQGQTLLRELRTMIVAGDDSMRTIEFKIDLTANGEKVHFGDTKEGSFAIRVPDSMTVDRKLGGTILNEHGERDDAAWGKRARWVDYSGPVDDKIMGVTILEHPTSFGHPCRWHVRTYGLFAANPFGEFHFVGGQPTAGHTIGPNETMHLHYKLLLHSGHADTELIEANWKQFLLP